MHPVHNHTEFSALDGLSKVEEIAARCEEIGAGGAFVTDHANVAAWRPFKKAMEARGLFAGFGMEGYQTQFENRGLRPEGKNARDGFHVVFAAMNETGVKNIYRLCDEAARTGQFYHPRVDWGLLEKYNEGIICTSACLGGLVAKGIKDDDKSAFYRYLKIFGDRFFVELHTYEGEYQKQVNQELVAITTLHGVPVVYANDAHYDKKENYPYHELLLAMQYRQDENFEAHHPPCLYIMSENDVRGRLHEQEIPDSIIDEAIRNSDLIADMCKDARLPGEESHLPVFRSRTATNKSNTELFIDNIEDGLVERYGSVTGDVETRAEEEMRTIIKAGLVDYFLIEKDACDWLDEQDIERGPGRGSAGGSIMSYAMKITDVDPLKYGLFFERFYNAGREKGLPDIDTDIEKFGRPKLLGYLQERWGKYNVIPIGNHVRMKPKAAIEKAAKPLGVPSGDADLIKRIIKKVPDIEIMTADLIGWKFSDTPTVVVAVLEDKIIHEDGTEEIVPSAAAELLKPWMDKYPDLFDVAQYMTGRLSGYSVHASAVVISDVDVRDYLPSMNAKEDDDGERRVVTMFDMREVEALGFPKFDFLGLQTLDIRKEARRLTGDDGYKREDYDNMPEDYWSLLDKGRGVGLFQVEDGKAAEIAQRLKPRNLLDLAAIVALNRPGPLRSGVVDRFIACRDGDASTEYLHQLLVPILSATFGDFLYQEQVIKYAGTIGYTPIEADNIRSMLGKKKVAAMQAEYPRYLSKAKQFMSEEEAKEIWDNIVGFSKYSFNLSHAVQYGLILAHTLWYKWKYPAEYLMACIKIARMSKSKKQERTAKYIIEARKIGIHVNSPDINHSEIDIAKVDGRIYFGLANVKNVGAEAAKWIISHRPYNSYQHFLDKLEMEQNIWEESKKGKSPKQTVRANQIECLRKVGAFAILEEETSVDRAKDEQELIGVVLSDNTDEIVEDNYEAFEDLETYSEALNHGTHVVPGVVTSVRETVTKYGNPMAHVSIEWPDPDGGYQDFNFVIFEDKLNKYKFLLKPRVVGTWEIRTNEKGRNLVDATRYHATASSIN